MDWRLDVRIVERSTGELVGGIVRPAAPADKVLWTHWHGEMQPGMDDAHWEWDRLIDLARALPDRFEVFALEYAGELQGLRMLEISEDEVEQYGIHALRLSTAPWNRPPERRFSGVGSVLVAVAVLRSVGLGLNGCIHCESLSGAESFHERNGMTKFDGLSGDGLSRFQFTEEKATKFLHRLRSSGLIE